jgi:hypothetical protein
VTRDLNFYTPLPNDERSQRMVTAKALKAEDGGLGSAALLGCPQNPRPIAIQGSERFREASQAR